MVAAGRWWCRYRRRTRPHSSTHTIHGSRHATCRPAHVQRQASGSRIRDPNTSTAPSSRIVMAGTGGGTGGGELVK
jgi:hypothetical protein